MYLSKMFHFCSVIARHSCDSSSLRSVIVEGHNSILHNFSVFLTLQLLTVWSGLWHCISVHSSLYIINSDKGYIKSYNSYINNQVVYLLSEEKKITFSLFWGKKMVFSVYISRPVHSVKSRPVDEDSMLWDSPSILLSPGNNPTLKTTSL